MAALLTARPLAVLAACTVLAAPVRAQLRAAAPGARAAVQDSVSAERPATLPDGTRRVAGRVVSPSDSAEHPIAGVWVTLHRVGRDTAGPIDSVRTDAAGRFALRYRPRGAADAVYFASTTYDGIAYFTAPLRDAVVEGDAAEISVFDTTSAAVPLTVRGRHLIVAEPDARGLRNVIEVVELSNDTTVTAVPAGRRGVWSIALPAGARDFAVRAGEVPSDGMVAAAGRALLMVPVAPGLKQVAFSYAVDVDAFPLHVAVERPTSVLEVLLEDPRGTATGQRLVVVEPVSVEGRSFRRFLAQDLKGGGDVVIDVSSTAASGARWALPALLVTLGLAMAGALLWTSRRRGVARPRVVVARNDRGPTTDSAPASVAHERERLLHEIAALDDAFAREPAATGAARAAYAAQRAELKERLAALLAAPGASR